MGCKEKMFHPTLLRVLGVIASLCILTSGILIFVLLGGLDPLRWVLAIYYIIFGAVFCLAEFNVKWVISRVVFMGNRFGRAASYIFAGVLIMGLNEIFSWILGAYILFVGLLNFVGYCCLRSISGDGRPKDAAAPGTDAGTTSTTNPISGTGSSYVPRAPASAASTAV